VSEWGWAERGARVGAAVVARPVEPAVWQLASAPSAAQPPELTAVDVAARPVEPAVLQLASGPSAVQPAEQAAVVAAAQPVEPAVLQPASQPFAVRLAFVSAFVPAAPLFFAVAPESVAALALQPCYLHSPQPGAPQCAHPSADHSSGSA